jgi:hypothetical protein
MAHSNTSRRKPAESLRESHLRSMFASCALLGAFIACSTPPPPVVPTPPDDTRPVPAPPTPAPPPPLRPLTSVCAKWGVAQGPLANLALQTLENVGRLDAAIYVQDANHAFQLAEGVEPEPGKSVDPVRRALAEINHNRVALDAFSAAVAAARPVPGTPHRYLVDVVRGESDSFSWKLSALNQETPTPEEWAGFHSLYDPTPEGCPVFEALVLEKNGEGQMQSRPQIRDFTNGCNCKQTGKRGHLNGSNCGPPNC